MVKENWLDKAISVFSPGWAVRRLASRQVKEQLQKGWAYDSGAGGARNYNWRVANDSAQQTDKWDRNRVRARARDLERNSDQMNAVIDAVVRNVYGPGWELQAKVGDGERRDYTKVNKQIEAAWKRWKKARNCDITCNQSFDEIIRMCVRRKKVDGGILIVKRYTRNDGFVPLRLQIFEVDELDELQTKPKRVNDTVVDGVEYNQWNRPVGYWFRQYDIQGYQRLEPIYVKAEDVIFYFTKTRPSQIREMSDMTPTILRIRDVNQYLEAVTVKERILACLAVFITKQTAGSSGIGRGINASTHERGGDVYKGKTLSPGMISEMAPGEDVKAVAPSGQTQDAANFIRMQQKMLAAGQGMSYEAVSRDMSETNYSSARQSSVEDERTFAAEQESLEAVMDEIYESFVISLVLAGQIDIPDFWEHKDQYLSHAWIMPAKRWIDPLKEANANATALKTGQKTFQMLCAEYGRNWKDVIDEYAEASKYAEKQDIDLSGVQIPDKAAASKPEGGEDNADEGQDGSSDQGDAGTDPDAESGTGGSGQHTGAGGEPDVPA
ncbi:phage portal protein [Eubacterium pyruvativorans]|uniref:phage portal protein n=1 Tax=Eubacterium pyruvativorans TaxID=155865 RepID=UPI0023F306B6|nr:phage portal protein [Eubacterium pyruvativorans]